jgi:hypothetical protein
VLCRWLLPTSRVKQTFHELSNLFHKKFHNFFSGDFPEKITIREKIWVKKKSQFSVHLAQVSEQFFDLLRSG